MKHPAQRIVEELSNKISMLVEGENIFYSAPFPASNARHENTEVMDDFRVFVFQSGGVAFNAWNTQTPLQNPAVIVEVRYRGDSFVRGEKLCAVIENAIPTLEDEDLAFKPMLRGPRNYIRLSEDDFFVWNFTVDVKTRACVEDYYLYKSAAPLSLTESDLPLMMNIETPAIFLSVSDTYASEHIVLIGPTESIEDLRIMDMSGAYIPATIAVFADIDGVENSILYSTSPITGANDFVIW